MWFNVIFMWYYTLLEPYFVKLSKYSSLDITIITHNNLTFYDSVNAFWRKRFAKKTYKRTVLESSDVTLRARRVPPPPLPPPIYTHIYEPHKTSRYYISTTLTPWKTSSIARHFSIAPRITLGAYLRYVTHHTLIHLAIHATKHTRTRTHAHKRNKRIHIEKSG